MSSHDDFRVYAHAPWVYSFAFFDIGLIQTYTSPENFFPSGMLVGALGTHEWHMHFIFPD